MLRLIQLKGGRGGVRLALAPNTDPQRVGAEIASTLGGAAHFLGRTKITVEVPDGMLTPELARTIAEVVSRFPGLTLGAITGPRAQAPAAQDSEPRVLHRTVRSGQEVVYQGDLVVLGDVHVGGRVIATGDVIVVGALRGFAWAGAEGDESAIIYAQPLQPTQVRIAGSIAQGSSGPGEGTREFAHLEDGKIVVEPFVPKSGRRPAARTRT